MALEHFFLVNALMDYILLSGVARGLGTFRPLRALALALGASAFALAAQAAPILKLPAVQLTLLMVLSLCVAPTSSLRMALTAAMSLAGAAAVAGPVVTLICGPGFRAVTPLTALAVAGLSAWRLGDTRRRPGWQFIELNIESGGHTARLRALIDTGNRLTEPLSGQGVLIVQAADIAPLMPERGCRSVAYGALGGGGVLDCFRPDRLSIRAGGRLKSAPPAWVAAYPGRIPGRVQALAPAEFAAL